MKTEEQGSKFVFLLYSPFLVICYCWLSSAAVPHLPLFPAIQFYYFKLSYKPLHRVVDCSYDFSCPWGVKLATLQGDRQHLKSTYMLFFYLLQQVHSNRIMEWIETPFPWISYLFSAIKWKKEVNSFYQIFLSVGQIRVIVTLGISE